MAGPIRLSKDERELIRSLVKDYGGDFTQVKYRRAADSILEKLTASEAPKKKREGMSVATAIEEFRGVLGRRLILPPNPSAGWYAQQSAQLARLGMTPELCRAVAQQAGTIWTGSIKAESIIRQADRLLHDYTSDTPAHPKRDFTDLADEEI